MPTPVVSTASTTWNGTLFEGSGTTDLTSSGKASFDVAWQSRAEAQGGLATPEELLAAAHSTCFSMALSHELTGNGTPPTRLETTAEVTFVAGEGITGIELSVRAEIEGIDESDFQRVAEAAKAGCPVSQALAGVDIGLTATLV